VWGKRDSKIIRTSVALAKRPLAAVTSWVAVAREVNGGDVGARRTGERKRARLRGDTAACGGL